MKPSVNEVAVLMKKRINNYYINSQGCWIHRNKPNNTGHVDIGKRVNGKFYCWYAHRLSYALYIGFVPEDKTINHTCGVPSCVNPNHLYVGTIKENNLDTYAHGTARPGGREPISKEEEEDMKWYSNMGLSQREVGKLMGISQATVSHHIGRGE